MLIVIYLLIFQACLGAFDVFWNHEFREALPTRKSALTEQRIHSIRELLYGVVFIGLANWIWGRIWAWLLASIILIEILLTAWDFVVEDRTRRLSATERITHLILSMTGGAYVAFLVPVILNWGTARMGFWPVDYGLWSDLLTAFGIGVLIWGVRDWIAARRLSSSMRDSRSKCKPIKNQSTDSDLLHAGRAS